MGIFAAAGDKAGEERPAGGLAGGAVAEVEADPHLLADVGQRRMASPPVHEEHIAALRFGGDDAVEG